MSPIYRWGLCMIGFCLFTVMGCQPTSENKSLRQGADVIEQMSSKRFLKRSSFMAMSKKRPSDFVRYIFSTMGAAEWPPRASASSLEREQAAAIGQKLIPDNVAFFPYQVNPKEKDQLVVTADDDVWQIVILAYRDPHKPPVFRRTWAFPRFK